MHDYLVGDASSATSYPLGSSITVPWKRFGSAFLSGNLGERAESSGHTEELLTTDQELKRLMAVDIGTFSTKADVESAIDATSAEVYAEPEAC